MPDGTTTTVKSGYVNGSDMLLYIGEKAIGHCTSHTTTFDTETKDRAVKPLASKKLSAGLWKSTGVTGLSITISFEGLAFYNESEFGVRHVEGRQAGKGQVHGARGHDSLSERLVRAHPGGGRSPRQ